MNQSSAAKAEVKTTSVITNLAGILAPLLTDKRADYVRFVGSKTELLSFATNGHVLVMVVSLGDYSHVGDVYLPQEIALRLQEVDWNFAPWADPELDKDLEAEPHLKPFLEGMLNVKHVTDALPGSRAPSAAGGYFLGKPLRVIGEVLSRMNVSVRFSGSDSHSDPMRFDSDAELTREEQLFWVSGVVMPSSKTGFCTCPPLSGYEDPKFTSHERGCPQAPKGVHSHA